MENKLIILIIVMSLLSPLQYVILYFFSPQNMVFNGMGTDEAVYFSAISSYEYGFKSPWIMAADGLEDNIFYNPARLIFPVLIH